MNEKISDTSQLVYVWLGSVLPKWAQRSMEFSTKSSDVKTVLLSSREIGPIEGVDRQYFLEDFYTSVEINDEKLKNINLYRDGFWLKTIERYFVLLQYMNKKNVGSLFHAELDNIVFSIGELGKRLDLIGKGFFLPTDSDTRGIGSLIYINDKDALEKLCKHYILNKSFIPNDMVLLGEMCQKYNNFFRLPTEKVISEISVKDDEDSYSSVGGIFDAAAIGQYILGVDPRNINTSLFNKFINENASINFDNITFNFNELSKKFTLIHKGNKNKYNLYNIHLHCKLIDVFANNKKFNKILNRLNNNKKTLISFNIYNILINNTKRIINFTKKCILID
jgi:hypothetical protein